jgi:hypothetical protein
MYKSYFKTDYFPLFCTVAVAVVPVLLAIVLGIVPLDLTWLSLLVTIALSFLVGLSAMQSLQRVRRRHRKFQEVHYINLCLMVFGYAYFVWSVYRLFRII